MSKENKTKEEVLHDHVDAHCFLKDKCYDATIDAMDEWAKQMMIGVADYINDRGMRWVKPDSWGSGKDNTERIVDEYLKSLQQTESNE